MLHTSFASFHVIERLVRDRKIMEFRNDDETSKVIKKSRSDK